MNVWSYPPRPGFFIRQVTATPTQPARVSVDRRQIVIFVTEDQLVTQAADAEISEVDARHWNIVHISREGLRLCLYPATFKIIGKRTEFLIRPMTGTAYYTIMEAD